MERNVCFATMVGSVPLLVTQATCYGCGSFYFNKSCRRILMKIDVNPALALPDGLELVTFERMDDGLTLHVVSTQESP